MQLFIVECERPDKDPDFFSDAVPLIGDSFFDVYEKFTGMFKNVKVLCVHDIGTHSGTKEVKL